MLVICRWLYNALWAMGPDEETIAAIATAAGAAGIAIVRVSGAAALPIADRLFRCSGAPPSQRAGGTFAYGHVHTGRDLDEAILLIYRAPASYTREDVVEFQCHGGSASAGRILRAVLDHGARLAAPGEFTRRAFCAGRIDLLQAEAVMDLISAQSERAAAAALAQLEGDLSQAIHAIYEEWLGIAADLEAFLDFEEHDLPPGPMQSLRHRLASQTLKLQTLASTYREGHLLREGALVVITGKPNVGKSTLLNLLLGKSRAIVTDIPGTTRDTLEESLLINGYPVRLVDTAGIRDATCHIEQEGIQRAKALQGRSDLNILLLDASEALDDLDRERMRTCPPSKTLVILNKIDKGQVTTPEDVSNFRSYACSLRSPTAADLIKRRISDALDLNQYQDIPQASVSERHLALIQDAGIYAGRAMRILEENGESSELLAATELRQATECLGMITGRHYYPELLDSIFSRFCIGK